MGDELIVAMFFLVGMVAGMIIQYYVGLNAEAVATQLCEYLDEGLVDYELTGGGRKFEYIKCGDTENLIEGIDIEKLVEITR